MGAKPLKTGKKKEETKCATCCSGKRKKTDGDIDAEIEVPKGTSADGQTKALISYTEGQMKADPCLDSMTVRVREDGGVMTTTGGWDRTGMDKNIWGAGVLGDSPVPSYTESFNNMTAPAPSSTLTPKGINMLTVKGL